MFYGVTFLMCQEESEIRMATETTLTHLDLSKIEVAQVMGKNDNPENHRIVWVGSKDYLVHLWYLSLDDLGPNLWSDKSLLIWAVQGLLLFCIAMESAPKWFLAPFSLAK